MAQQSESQNNNQTPEIKEPPGKIQKVHENGVPEISSFLRVKNAAEMVVPGRGKALIPTDLSIAVPEGTYAPVGAGVIEADYRGPVGFILFNHSDVDFLVKMGDRVAQSIIEKIITPKVEEVEELDSTVEGSGGFGSTG
ncbi:hypothetical protein MKW94_030119, partial [Papaver nudicaule]|nr:hypothetical protein [Papaver nudicaule]